MAGSVIPHVQEIQTDYRLIVLRISDRKPFAMVPLSLMHFYVKLTNFTTESRFPISNLQNLT